MITPKDRDAIYSKLIDVIAGTWNLNAEDTIETIVAGMRVYLNSLVSEDVGKCPVCKTPYLCNCNYAPPESR